MDYSEKDDTRMILESSPQLLRSGEIEFNNALCFDYKGCVKRSFSCLCPYIPGVMISHTKLVQQWIKFFDIACLVAVFVDPWFFFLLSAQQENKCIVINQPMTKSVVVFIRSMTDFIYLLHMILQFRLAYVAPKSRVVGAGEIVEQPKKIALNYLKGYFFIDLFVVLPLHQLIILVILPKFPLLSGGNFTKNLLRTAILVQYIPRFYRFLPLLAGQSPNGFIFETAWANFAINLATFMLAGHVVGSFWYLFGLQIVVMEAPFKILLRIQHGISWKENVNSTACFTEQGFAYGIYNKAMTLTTEKNIITRYVYSLFWGFQQISTQAGNLAPSSFIWEVLFTMAIIGLGLLRFALLVGNMQNFLQSLGRRRLDMSLKRRDIERWMSCRGLPDELRKYAF
ncbi:Ion transport domain containing protein [Parasponia andersonii]|uniref:Ion transport domain containing protein n=1 Tax=Parasponia andersonii TaxID=3476 RepID=A0A2P5E4Z5_PARAD|nr:Ion transport domain containing protein [Parasponia andersonii]